MNMKHNYKDILHNVNLTEGQIGVILCSLEKLSTDNIETKADIEAIFEELEGSVDRFYDNMEKKKSKQPTMEWTDE
tara:strand:- start:166 stop:393 length:228 start_codon:yes stop_codon:yes gene_type:complete